MNGLRKAATAAYVSALRKGLIVRPLSCEKCGSTAKIEGHHEDYEKPLEIAWLCRKCHRARHRELGWGPGNYGGKGNTAMKFKNPSPPICHDSDTPIGIRIFLDRRSACLTQAEVASSVPTIQRVTLANIERGNLIPNEQLGKSILKAIQELRTK